LAGDTHRSISHDDQEAGPLPLGEMSQGKQNSIVNFLPIRLTEANYQYA